MQRAHHDRVVDLPVGEGAALVWAHGVHGANGAVRQQEYGDLSALHDVRAALADGQIDDAVVMCPLHQYAFSFDTGACTSEGVESVRTYPASVRGGILTLSV
jgi:nitrite reductase (NADH) small subunit